MARPQRHRLLHGYPLAAAMPFADADVRSMAAAIDSRFEPPRNPRNPLLVGVLPHPFCNPKISGCGFCTFPHESYSALKAAATSNAVSLEIEQRIANQPDLYRAQVSGLYFGGGTANLTPANSFRLLARSLNNAFDLEQAEVSLEGVARNFVRGNPSLLDIMTEEIQARHFRISVGIQTFSESRLEQMGRLAFGRADTFEEAVEAAHVRNMTASGDLLCNLPGQSLEEMKRDIRQAIDIGLDQICVYHLVMFPGLGTEWARDPAMVKLLPANEEASSNWNELRSMLLESGFRQTSLTNFERAELAFDPRRYRYEPISYESNHCQVVGFGPSGISFTPTDNGQYALKTMNPESSSEYMQAVHSPGAVWNRYFQYDRLDFELLLITRRLASLRFDDDALRMIAESEASQSYAERLELLVAEKLLERNSVESWLTPKGMFYSDSIAGLLAEARWEHGSKHSRPFMSNDNRSGHM